MRRTPPAFAGKADDTNTRTMWQRNADAIAEIADASLDGTTAGISAVTIGPQRMDGVGACWGHDGMTYHHHRLNGRRSNHQTNTCQSN